MLHAVLLKSNNVFLSHGFVLKKKDYELIIYYNETSEGPFDLLFLCLCEGDISGLEEEYQQLLKKEFRLFCAQHGIPMQNTIFFVFTK